MDKYIGFDIDSKKNTGVYHARRKRDGYAIFNRYCFSRLLKLQTGQIQPENAKKDQLSPSDTGKKTNGRYRTRTCDPLIKSQLLCQLS